MAKFILALDQGTTGSTALLIDVKSKKIIAKKNQEFPQIFPKPGWVEHDLNNIWDSIKSTTQQVIKEANISSNEIVAIGITNQRETTCAFNSKGEPLHNAIVWQDRRTGDFCKKNKEHEKEIKMKTGLNLDPYFSATKMKWLIENEKKVQQALKNDDLKFGTIDTYLLYRLSSGVSFATESTNASRTLLMNLEKKDWDKKLCEFFNIPMNTLPKIQDSISVFGKTKSLDFLPDGIPIACILGDQQSALFGQAGYQKGAFKCTYGTGAFALLNTGKEIIHSTQGLLTTSAYSYQGEQYFALEGATYIAGACVQWLRDQMKFFENSAEIEKLALAANEASMENILFMPFFTGIASPYWISEAKASILGLTRDSGIEQISRGALEGIAMSINDLITAFRKDSVINDIRVDGGAVANNFLMQLQANFSQTSITVPEVIETTAYGVGLGCLISTNECKLNDIEKVWSIDKVFKPEKENPYFKNKYNQWSKEIEKLYLS